MIYLIIPVLCFVLLGGLFWASMGPGIYKMAHKGKISDFDLILPVLMTARVDERHLSVGTHGDVTLLEMTFPGPAVKLELPLITPLQQSQRDSYLTILRDLELDPRVSNQNRDHDTLEIEVKGSPTRVSEIVKDAFARLFELDLARDLEFRVFAHWSDQGVIDRALRGNRSSAKEELLVAATQRHQIEPTDEARNGCILGLAGLLLLPLPFMIAYLQFGYIAASAVLIAIFVCREVYRRWKGSGRGFHFFDVIKLTVVGLAAATIYFKYPLYLQLIPTIALSVAAFAELLSVLFDVPSPFDLHDKRFSRLQRMLLSFAILATCVGGVVTNELLRANVTLDVWAWFFAFVRVELFLGLITSSMPFLFYQVWHDTKTEGSSDSS